MDSVPQQQQHLQQEPNQQKDEDQWEAVEYKKEEAKMDSVNHKQEEEQWDVVEQKIGLDQDVLQNLLERCPENRYCFDCQSPNPTMASVNNGIFICVNCAAIHSAFNNNISNIKSFTDDAWNDDDIGLMQQGGNRDLAEFFDTYGLLDEGSDMRLGSTAAQHYRNNILAKVHRNKFEEMTPNLQQGRSTYVNKGPGFVGKSIQVAETGASKVKDFSNTIGLTDTIIESKDYVKDQAEQHKVAERTKAVGQKIKFGAQNVANYTKQKTNQYQVKQKAQFVGSSVKKGASNFIGGIGKVVQKNKNGNQQQQQQQNQQQEYQQQQFQQFQQQQEEFQQWQQQAYQQQQSSRFEEQKEAQPFQQSQFSKNAQFGEPAYADHNPYEDYC